MKCPSPVANPQGGGGYRGHVTPDPMQFFSNEDEYSIQHCTCELANCVRIYAKMHYSELESLKKCF